MDRDTFLRELDGLERAFTITPPELELSVRDPALGVEGYVVVWNTGPGMRGPLGPCGKGGTRITPQVSLAEIAMLAKRMALKNAAADLAFGGAKSGLRADPDEPGFEKKYRRFVKLVQPVLRDNGGVFGGFGFDIGARKEHPHWACSETGSRTCFTGKPPELGGTDYDREGIAGLGVATAAKVLLEHKGRTTQGVTFSVQGVGAMGAAVLRYFCAFGANPRFVSDVQFRGTLRYTSAEPSAKFLATVEGGDIQEIQKACLEMPHELLDLNAVLFEEVDVLFPCALQGVIDVNNAPQIKAQYIVEGANNPCTEEARTALDARRITVLPDFMVNSGGIIAAYIEMTSPLVSTDAASKKTPLVGSMANEAKILTREKISKNVAELLSLSDHFSLEPARVAMYMALRNMFN